MADEAPIGTRCVDCEREIEVCACCESPECPCAICYRDLIVALGQSTLQPHAHGG